MSIRRPSPLLCGLVYIKFGADLDDLHSGMFGGTVPNRHVVVQGHRGLHDDNLRVAVPGFYDGIRPHDRIDSWYALGFDDKEFLATAGLETDLGEKVRGFWNIWSRPTVE